MSGWWPADPREFCAQQGKLTGASVFVAVISLFFLGTLRLPLMALAAVAEPICATALVEREARSWRSGLRRVLVVGATGYGFSPRPYLLAQRAFGAARTGSVFAFAPFIGAALAMALGDRGFSGLMLLGSGLMLAGMLLHLAERHSHEHTPDAHQDHQH